MNLKYHAKLHDKSAAISLPEIMLSVYVESSTFWGYRMNNLISMIKRLFSFLFVEKKIHKRKWFWPAVIIFLLIGAASDKNESHSSSTTASNRNVAEKKDSAPEVPAINVDSANWRTVGAGFTSFMQSTRTRYDLIATSWIDEASITINGDIRIGSIKTSVHHFDEEQVNRITNVGLPKCNDEGMECFYRLVALHLKAKSPDNYYVDRVEVNCSQRTMRPVARVEYEYVPAERTSEIDAATGARTEKEIPERWDWKNVSGSNKWQDSCALYDRALCQIDRDPGHAPYPQCWVE